MSVHDSWIAVRDLPAEALLDLLGLEETGEEDVAACAADPYAWGRTEAGWTILYANFNGLAHPDNLGALSRHGTVIACDYQDQVDTPSGSMIAVRNGKTLWKIDVVGDLLETEGKLPPAFGPIHDRLKALQDVDPDSPYFWDIPIDLGRELCGFSPFESEVRFRSLRPRKNSIWHGSLTLGDHRSYPEPPTSSSNDVLWDLGQYALWWVLGLGAFFTLLHFADR
ncbi:MAG: hypothetical protein ACOY5R_11200 [Pseudomonadota bacterium]|uniref:hypothetical protein n=1 Tax=Rhizorhabdus phycosphaerae TaxID=2711156 RepID=UPI0013EAC783|nr:hypothetical protein [Rhizorhabdus phycosphaerae]